eukprot:2278987-Rhodomonas_salina.1
MEWLKVSVAEKEQEEHLCFLLKWCSIIRNHSPTAPIFFVGTHSDTVPDLDEHKRISDLICDRFDERFQVRITSRAARLTSDGICCLCTAGCVPEREHPVWAGCVLFLPDRQHKGAGGPSTARADEVAALGSAGGQVREGAGTGGMDGTSRLAAGPGGTDCLLGR